MLLLLLLLDAVAWFFRGLPWPSVFMLLQLPLLFLR